MRFLILVVGKACWSVCHYAGNGRNIFSLSENGSYSVPE